MLMVVYLKRLAVIDAEVTTPAVTMAIANLATEMKKPPGRWQNNKVGSSHEVR
jgi:hypothetical protein